MIGFEWENKINYKIAGGLDELISSEDVAFYREYFMRLDEKNTDVYGRGLLSGRIVRKIQNILRHLEWNY